MFLNTPIITRILIKKVNENTKKAKQWLEGSYEVEKQIGF